MVLFKVLSGAIDEAPKEAKRFPQAMWDAVGDLSVGFDVVHLSA